MTTAITTTIKHDVLKGLQEIDEISSFRDIERLFLRGAGNSPLTYNVYKNKIKLFYDFTEGLHPILCKPADIESFYDYRVNKVDRNTAYLDIQALKCFFKGVERVIPLYVSPFKRMTTKLLKKLNRSKKSGTKKALNRLEVRGILDYLQEDKSLKGVEDHAIFRFLYATGFRSSELCGMRWGDIEFDEDEKSYFVNGIGKGERAFRQEVVDPAAVIEAERYFKKSFHRKPKLEDHVFYTVPSYNGDEMRPLPYHSLYNRIVDIGRAVRAAGIVKRDIEFTPHLLRRSIITNLSKSGMRLKALQKFSRHSNIQTLVDHYVDDEEPAKKYFVM